MLVSTIVVAPSIAGASTISAPFVTMTVGDTFTVPIAIAGGTDLTSWQFDLAFDSAVVQANSVAEGTFLSSFGTTFFVPGAIDNGAGLISVVAGSYVDLLPVPSGNGVLANIELVALAPGVSSLTFSSVFLNFDDQGFDASNGQITVTGMVPVPESPTLWLLAGGVGMFCARRRYRKEQRS